MNALMTGFLCSSRFSDHAAGKAKGLGLPTEAGTYRLSHFRGSAKGLLLELDLWIPAVKNFSGFAREIYI
ncbi:hypothetical protein BH11PAT2_BH11PAT2_01560 [soil metagenome]